MSKQGRKHTRTVSAFPSDKICLNSKKGRQFTGDVAIAIYFVMNEIRRLLL